ncbi:MAG: hypothetical protein ABFD50_06105, partial [Smithella sp.]
NYELNRVESFVRDTNQNNFVAEEGLNEQVKSFQERIIHLQNKIRAAKEEKENQKILLKRKEENYYKLSLDVAAIREKKEAAERQFYEAQASLQEKKRTHESIIIKTALATTKGSQTPAEASAEAILDKLAEVKNDAKTQHSSSTTEVTNFQVRSEAVTQAISEARIIAVRLISFVNEGDSVRVNMAFRVRTVLEDQEDKESLRKKIIYKEPVYRIDNTSPELKPKPVPDAPGAPVITPSFQRDYHPITTTNALGCVFDIRSVRFLNDGIHVWLVVVNTASDERSVAFYDDRFGRWNRSRIYDDNGKYYPATQAYVIKDDQKKLMYEIDSRGRGISIQPQRAVAMELNFSNIPLNIKTVKINLHPFIYYKNGWRQTWQEFDLPVANINLSSEKIAKPDTANGKSMKVKSKKKKKTAKTQ